MSEAPLSFQEASEKFLSKKLSWRPYLHQIFSRCLPQWHATYMHPLYSAAMMKEDPFTFTVFCYHDKVTGITDPCQLESIFHAYEDGKSLDDIAAKVNGLTKETATYLCASLAMYALMDRKPDLLQFALDRSAFRRRGAFESTYAFRDIADRSDFVKEPGLVKVLSSSEWRKENPWSPGYIDWREGAERRPQVRARW